MTPIHYYAFGTGAGSTVTNLQQLASIFNPYGIAGTTVIHTEWERYQPFNNTNFAFGTNSLNLTASIPPGGGLYPGGIRSGQIWSKQAFLPGVTGHQVYAFRIRFKFPNGRGMWPAAWFYTPTNGNGSEIDVAEFQMMKNQNQYDWTGFDHGPNRGSVIFDRRTNPWTWHPGIDFSAGYHNYELVWTPDATYKYVDGELIFAQYFQWTASSGGQLGINLAVGTDDTSAPELQPNFLSEFPGALSIQYIGIWAK